METTRDEMSTVCSAVTFAVMIIQLSWVSIMFWYFTGCVIDAVTSSTGLAVQKVKPDVYYYESSHLLGLSIYYSYIMFH